MEEQARILGFDVGSRTIGVAVSDPLGLTAQGHGVIRRTGRQSDLAEIRQLTDLYQPAALVVGYPLTLSGQAHRQAQAVDAFIADLEPLGIPIVRQDERFTTKIAERVLVEADVSRSKRRGVIDQQAAILILQSYLDQMRRERKPDGTP